MHSFFVVGRYQLTYIYWVVSMEEMVDVNV